MGKFGKEAVLQLLALGVGGALFLGGGSALRHYERINPAPEIQVALPLFVQVIMAGGDRFLAANLGSVRALITESAKMKPDEYRIQAKVQKDVSWLNPAHEDNYYVATATLPWNGQVDAAQMILRRATLARQKDSQPPFFYAFNLVHFKKDPVQAAAWLRMAAAKMADEDERILLESFAARWVDRAEDLAVAIAVVEAMAKQAKRKDFRDYLAARAFRLRGLVALREAALAYRRKFGEPLQSLDQLVHTGLIAAIPVDPLGAGYALDAAGTPIFGGVRVDEYGNKY